MRRLSIRAAGVLALATVATLVSDSAAADPEECRDAVDQYRSAHEDLYSALKQYVVCLRDSRGHDDCSSEFSSLQTAQSDFEDAVSQYESECD